MYIITNQIDQFVLESDKARVTANLEAIRTVKQLQSENRQPTPEEIEVLAKFCGWGSFWKVFDLQSDRQTQWQRDVNQQLREILTADEFDAAETATINAHYTHPQLYRATWECVKALGFNGGSALSPSCGTGYSIGTQPTGMKIEWTAVEMEPISAAIAAYLYPKATVYNNRFQDVGLPEGNYDLVIDNFPFGTERPHDPAFNHLNLEIHNYFMAKSMTLLRPGGLLAVFSSKGFLDHSDRKFRSWLADRARLLHSFRLPNTAHGSTGNTKVTTDLLFFQKLEEGMEHDPIWVDTEKVSAAGFTLPLNKFYVPEFHDHFNLVPTMPHYMLGTLAGDELYSDGSGRWGLLPNPDHYPGTEHESTAPDALHKAIVELAEQEFKKVYNPNPIQVVKPRAIPPQLQEVKPLAFCEYEGKLYQRKGNTLQPVVSHEARIKSFFRLKNVLSQVLNAQSLNGDKALSKYREGLNVVYNNFKKKFGPTNSRTNIKFLGEDPNYYLVRALENSDGSKADIFFKRVARPSAPPKKASNPKDALIKSLQEKGKVDLNFMAQLLKSQVEPVVESLRSQGLLFYDYQDSNPGEIENKVLDLFVTADEYLSGNVRLKLARLKLLREKCESSNRMELWSRHEDNAIVALQKHQPAPMLPKGDQSLLLKCLEAMGVNFAELKENEQQQALRNFIETNIGSIWIDPEVYEEFASEILQFECRIQYNPVMGFWNVTGVCDDRTNFGTEDKTALEIFANALNLQDPRVMIYIKGPDGSYLDKEASSRATENARDKRDRMRTAFVEWLWKDEDRAIYLCKAYNDKLNNYRERRFNGSHLQLPGSNPEINLRRHQKDVVWMSCQQQATFAAHEVGAGKTIAAIACCMEWRRLGLAHKPLIVCLNGTEAQFADEFRRLYPTAKILFPDKKSFQKEYRQLLVTQIATGDWDCVIITQSQFFRINMTAANRTRYMQEELESLREMLEEAKNDADSRVLVKQLKARIKAKESRMEKINKKPKGDDAIYFEQLNVDALVIDEIHTCKNLDITTKQYNIAGIPSSFSMRAYDTAQKIWWVLERGGKVLGMTGTKVSNTMAEVYVWQKMFQRPVLEEDGTEHFDTWSAEYAEAVTSSEINPAGQYKVKTRFKRFNNLKMLGKKIRGYCHIVTTASIEQQQKEGLIAASDVIQKPEPRFVDEVVPPSESQMAFLKSAVKRGEAIQSRHVDPKDDNMLKLTSDLMKAALAMPLLGANSLEPDNKLHRLIWNVWQIHKATSEMRGTQMVFCDFSTPKDNNLFTVYRYVRDAWVMLGIPAGEIEFIHDCDNVKQRRALRDRIKSGATRIVLGSTEKLGTGFDAATLVIALHHVDAAWKPAQMTQREGRGVRQGNVWPQCFVFRYITERLDALRWQTLQWKQEMIEKFMSGADLDSIEDIGDVVYSYKQVLSLSIGDPILIRQSDLQSEFQKLILLQQEHSRTQMRIKSNINSLKSGIKNRDERMPFLEQDVQTARAYNNRFAVTFFGKQSNTTNQDREKVGANIRNLEETYAKRGLVGWHRVGEFAGFDLAFFCQGQTVTFFLRGKHGKTSYQLSLGNWTHKLSNMEIATSLEAFVRDGIANSLLAARQQQEQDKANLAREESVLGKAFSHADRLHEIKLELADIEQQLAEKEEIALIEDKEEDDDEENEDDAPEIQESSWHGSDKPVEYFYPHASVIEMLKTAEHQVGYKQPQWLAEVHAVVDQKMGRNIVQFPQIEAEQAIAQ